MSVTNADEIRARTHKEYTCRSGNTYLIRKLTQLDYMPKGLAGLYIDTVLTSAELGKGTLPKEMLDKYMERLANREEESRKWCVEHPDEVFAMETDMLVKGVVLPRVVRTEVEAVRDRSAIYVGDVGKDRDELVAALNEWSGLLPEQMREVDKFRGKVVGDPGPDGQVLRDAAVGDGAVAGGGVPA